MISNDWSVTKGHPSVARPAQDQYTRTMRRYGVLMSVPASSSSHIPSIPPGATPHAIRSALVGDEVGDFDREYRQALAEAAETLDLSGVLDMLRRWQRVAWSAQDDPEAHRRMLERADQLAAGQDIATESWQETKRRLGL
jgi:hypothetical protein